MVWRGDVAGKLAGWFVSLLLSWLVGLDGVLLIGRLVGRSVCLFVCFLVGWLACLLVGLLVRLFVGFVGWLLC